MNIYINGWTIRMEVLGTFTELVPATFCRTVKVAVFRTISSCLRHPVHEETRLCRGRRPEFGLSFAAFRAGDQRCAMKAYDINESD
jgi:hypothetical protein